MKIEKRAIMNKFGLVCLLLFIACLSLATAAAPIVLVVPREPIGNQTVSYGYLTLSAEAYLDEDLAPDLNVFAESELFGKITLYDDGGHADGKRDDGIYGNTVLVNSGAGERHAIEFTASSGTRFDKKMVYFVVIDGLVLEFDLPELAYLGETISITGQALNAGGEPMEGTAIVSFKREGWQDQFTIDSVETNFSTDYLMSLSLPTGAWDVEISVEDEFGNSGSWKTTLFVSQPIAEKITPEFIEPQSGVNLPRSAVHPVTIKVTRKGDIVTGATVVIVFEGEKKELTEVGHGYYTGHLELLPGSTLGMQELCVEITKVIEDVKETEVECLPVFVSKAELVVELLEIQEDYFAGEEYNLKISVAYANGVPVNNAEVYCQGTSAAFENDGQYTCRLRFMETGLTEMAISVTDAFENFKVSNVLLKVRLMTWLEFLTLMTLRYGWIALIIIIVAAYLYWNSKPVKLKRLKKRKQTINLNIRKLQVKFFEKKNINEKEYNELLKRYNNQLTETEEELIALEKIKEGK